MSGEEILGLIAMAFFFTGVICFILEALASKTYPDDPDGQQDKEAHGGSV